jgi:hypothetical protein
MMYPVDECGRVEYDVSLYDARLWMSSLNRRVGNTDMIQERGTYKQSDYQIVCA